MDLSDASELLPTSHKIDHRVSELPTSLKEALRVFILARAIRIVRGDGKAHNSMLVNVSRFMNVQKQVRDLLYEHVEEIRSSVRVNGALCLIDAMKDPQISELRYTFDRHFATTCPETWIAVQECLNESVSAIGVVEVNSQSADSLDYTSYQGTGLNVVAVGGLSLSRGLTLEGLTVSYFLRRSMMYDTLFQMGRWFGYRVGYEDLCRVWMPEEAQGWYEHITDSVDELRAELVRMQRSNATPMDFGLKVRSHPDSLLVTARNKMGTGKDYSVKIGLANQFVETAILRRDGKSVTSNLRAVVRLAEDMRKGGLAPEHGEKLGGSRLVRNVPVDVVYSFIGSFINHRNSYLSETEPVRRYIYARTQDELSSWDVLFAGVSKNYRSSKSLVDNCLGFELVCQRRVAGKQSDKSTLVVTNKQRVSSRGIARIGLTPQEAEAAEREHDLSEERSGGSVNYPDRIYAQVRRKPLLIVHLLAIGSAEDDLSVSTPIAAWSISFPKTSLDDPNVEYVVNTTWYRENLVDGDEDEDFNENGDS